MSRPGREVALICTGDDHDLGARLRAAAWRGIVPTVFVRPADRRGRLLAAAAGAEIGSVWPDISGSSVLVEHDVEPAAAARLSDRVIVLGADVGAVPPARRVLRLVKTVHLPEEGPRPAIGDWGEGVLDALSHRGWRMQPAGDPIPPPAPVRLDGLRAVHLTSVHRPDDGRILHREVMALRGAGAAATVLGLDPLPTRPRRLPAGWRLVAEARRRGVEVVHVHDPELLPAAWALCRRSGQKVVYDAHEYLGQTTRTKPWIPRHLRRPTALAVERVERLLAGRVDAVVAVTEDMALDFAEAGTRAVSVGNFASQTRFPHPGPPEGRLVAYVGALDDSRGLALMLEAFPMVGLPDARLLLAGPGDPGRLPPGVEHLGPVAYDAVPAVLGRAAVIWVPLRPTPNNERGRLTKVMEAMASGRPLVTSDLARTAAIVGQVGCGLVAPFDDPAAHAGAIRRLLLDPHEAGRMGAAGRSAFLGRLNFEREAAKLVGLYAELTGRGTGHAA